MPASQRARSSTIASRSTSGSSTSWTAPTSSQPRSPGGPPGARRGGRGGRGVGGATRMSQFDPEKAGHKAGKIAALAKDPVGGEAGTYDIVFDPLILGSLIDQIGGGGCGGAQVAGGSLC